jgi:hypothetical protein
MSTAIKYGVGFGLATCTWTLIEYALGFHTTHIAAGQVSSYVALVLPLAFVVLAGLAARREAGALTFTRALGVALVVMLVGDTITTPFLWAYHHFILPDWLERLTDYERAKMLLAGTAPADVDRKLAAMAVANSTRAQIVGGLVGSTVLGFVIGVPMALLLRRRGDDARPVGGASGVAA